MPIPEKVQQALGDQFTPVRWVGFGTHYSLDGEDNPVETLGRVTRGCSCCTDTEPIESLDQIREVAQHWITIGQNLLRLVEEAEKSPSK